MFACLGRVCSLRLLALLLYFGFFQGRDLRHSFTDNGIDQMRSLFLAAALGFAAFAGQAQAANNCDLTGITDADWLMPDPTTLGEIPNGTSANNCDFHIFSWRWFNYLMNPLNSDMRNFENRAVHPLVDADTCTSVQAGNMVDVAHRGLATSVMKLPDIPGQAGPGDALYDKDGNIVFYSRNFTVNECDVDPSGNFHDPGAPNPNFPTGLDQTVELKVAWRVLDASMDNSTYYTIQSEIEGIGPMLLGMVGFHIVVNTADHPEFVWATFEHVTNTPNCTVMTGTGGFDRPQPSDGWTFLGETCNACVAQNFSNGTDLNSVCSAECAFNDNATKPVLDALGNVEISGTPSNICLDQYYGTPDPTQGSGLQNVENIQYLNTLLVGPGGIMTSLPDSDAMAVFKNYFLAGAVWTDFTKLKAPTDPFDDALTASIGLANSTLESFTQAGAGFDKGCFTCHGGATSTNTAAASHLLDFNGAPGLINRCDVKAGPIFNQSQAETICPATCTGEGNAWNGNWTTIATEMSVCGCNTCVAN